MDRERRRHPRLPLRRPVKLRVDGTGQFLSGDSVDVSAGGARVRLTRRAPLAPGQAVALVVAEPGEAVVASGRLAAAVVRRAENAGDGAEVAVQFLEPQALAGETAGSLAAGGNNPEAAA